MSYQLLLFSCIAIFVHITKSCYGCEDSGAIQLQGGGSHKQGRVEICIDHEWGTICDDDWDSANARVVCRQLGFSDQGARAHSGGAFTMGTGRVHGGRYDCNGNEQRLVSCARASRLCGRDDYAGVTCTGANCVNGSVRLVDGRVESSGRVEVCMEQQWGTVCDDNWGTAESAVICRQLNFPAAGSIPVSFGSFGQSAIDAIHFSNTQCTGSEQEILDCQLSTQHSCSHREDAGVVCQEVCDNGAVRLVNALGQVQMQGQVQVCLDRQWTSVCDASWTEQDARVVCKQLGYSEHATLDTTQMEPYNGPTGSIVFKNINCTGVETKLVHCQTLNYLPTQNDSAVCSQRTSVGVSCSINEVDRPTETTTSDSNKTVTATATPPRASSSYLMWLVVSICVFLSISLIINNLLCLLAIAKKSKQRSTNHGGNSCSNPQNLEAPNSVLSHEDREDQLYSVIYESNPVYGQSPGCEQPFDVEANPSYRETSVKEKLIMQTNPSYGETNVKEKLILQSNPSYGETSVTEKLILQSNPSYRETIVKKKLIQQTNLETSAKEQLNPSYSSTSAMETPDYRNLTVSYTTQDEDGYIN